MLAVDTNVIIRRPKILCGLQRAKHMAHWWRYSDTFNPNEFIVDELSPPVPFPDLGMHLRARDVFFESMNQPEIFQLPRFKKYILNV